MISVADLANLEYFVGTWKMSNLTLLAAVVVVVVVVVVDVADGSVT